MLRGLQAALWQRAVVALQNHDRQASARGPSASPLCSPLALARIFVHTSSKMLSFFYCIHGRTERSAMSDSFLVVTVPYLKRYSHESFCQTEVGGLSAYRHQGGV